MRTAWSVAEKTFLLPLFLFSSHFLPLFLIFYFVCFFHLFFLSFPLFLPFFSFFSKFYFFFVHFFSLMWHHITRENKIQTTSPEVGRNGPKFGLASDKYSTKALERFLISFFLSLFLCFFNPFLSVSNQFLAAPFFHPQPCHLVFSLFPFSTIVKFVPTLPHPRPRTG